MRATKAPETCAHDNIEVQENAFRGCVRLHRPDLCEPRSHDGISVFIMCRDCDANRHLNINGEFVESSRWMYISDRVSYGPWKEVCNVA